MAQCLHSNKTGKQCGGLQIAGSEYCFIHTPGLDAQRFEARQKGGRSNKRTALPDSEPDAKLESVADVQELLARTINAVRKGKLDARLGNAVGYLSAILLRAREVGDIEDRLAKVEAAIEKGKG